MDILADILADDTARDALRNILTALVSLLVAGATAKGWTDWRLDVLRKGAQIGVRAIDQWAGRQRNDAVVKTSKATLKAEAEKVALSHVPKILKATPTAKRLVSDIVEAELNEMRAQRGGK